MKLEVKNTQLGLIIVSLFIIAGAAYFAWNQNGGNQEIIVYPVQCDDWIKAAPPLETQNFQNCHQRRALDRVGIKIDKTNNTVVNWFIDENPPTFYTATNCAIANSDNWGCNNGAVISTGAGESFGFNNGKFFNNAYTDVIFVSESQWDSINNGAPTPFGADVPSI